MLNFFIFLVPAVVVVLIFKLCFHREITTKEFFIHIVSSLVITAIVYGLSTAYLYSDMVDTEIINSKIDSKWRHVEVCSEYSSCENYFYKTEYYSTISKGKTVRKSRQVKVFLYSTEYDWYIKSQSGETVKIRRVNDRGDVEPKRWTTAKIGDYFGSENLYINPLLHGEVSLFNTHENKGKFSTADMKGMPKYPEVFDYYKFNPVVNRTGFNFSDISTDVNSIMRTTGKEKQVNVVFVVYNIEKENAKFSEMLLQKWNGTKKNDVILIIGIDNNKFIRKFNSASYANNSGNELLHSTLKMQFASKEEILDISTSRDIIQNVNSLFKRLPASEFKYLLTDVKPSNMLILVVIILTLGIGIILTRNDERNR